MRYFLCLLVVLSGCCSEKKDGNFRVINSKAEDHKEEDTRKFSAPVYGPVRTAVCKISEQYVRAACYLNGKLSQSEYHEIVFKSDEDNVRFHFTGSDALVYFYQGMRRGDFATITYRKDHANDLVDVIAVKKNDLTAKAVIPDALLLDGTITSTAGRTLGDLLRSEGHGVIAPGRITTTFFCK